MSGPIRKRRPRCPAAAAAAAGIATAILLAAFAAPTPAAAGDLSLAGSVDARLSASLNEAGDGGGYGFEEFANLRLKAGVGDRGSVHIAANLIAAAGNGAASAAGSADSLTDPFIVGPNYAAAIELERLYFRLEGDYFDADAGLMRLAFGYGHAWSPTDFLGLRNPLRPDARPRGVLGIAASAYPADPVKLKAFAVAAAEPLEASGEGIVSGFAADFHGRRASLQALYAFEAPTADTERGVHRLGGSLKLEAGAGIVLDALWTYDGEARKGIERLEASAGLDYSFLEGDLYVLCQYLYNGDGARSGLQNEHYVYSAFSYRFDDYSAATLAAALSLEDFSAAPSLTVEHEPFQGLSLSLSCRVPLDARVFSADGDRGEFGPTASDERVGITAKAKLRF